MDTMKLKEMLDESNITQYELAKRLNIAPTTVNQWFARNSLKDKYLGDICRVTGFDIGELIPNYNKEDYNRVSSIIVESPNDKILFIPRYKNVTASAGEGDYIDGIDIFEEDEPIPMLRTDLPSDRDSKYFEAIKVKGTSMLPTFMPNDWVIFDKKTSFYDGDGLYVLNYAGNLLIKRLQYDMGRNSMDIISDNHEYSNYSINLSENQENLNIIGIVMMRAKREV